MLKKLLIILFVLTLLLTGFAVWTNWQTAPSQTLPPPTPIATSPTTTSTSNLNKEVTIISTPQIAMIYVNGLSIGQTPLQYTFADNTVYELKAIKTGYIPLVLSYSPTDTTLRITLVADSVTSAPQTDTTISNSPPATPPLSNTQTPASQTTTSLPAIPFPSPPNLRVLTQVAPTFTYTPPPAAVTPSATSSPSSQPTPTPAPTASTPPPNSLSPSPEQIVAYGRLMAEYSGVHDFPPDDDVREGTSGEKGVIVSDQWFYTENTFALAGFPIRFINENAIQCTLKAQTARGQIDIGTLTRNDSLFFTAAVGTNETMQFHCQERPSIRLSLTLFS